MIKLNQSAPDFELPADDGEIFRLSERLGERVLLVFYPGDNTPVCTAQLCDYRDGIDAFSGLGVEVVGISPDDADSHHQFKEKHSLPFVLLSDPDYTVAKQYDCKGALGMKRGVFLVDETGVIRHAHVESLALFRRKAKELLTIIRDLDSAQAS